MKIQLVSMLGLLAISACASKPENIAPAFISESKYDDWSCHALAAERARYDAALAQTSAQQRKARSNDTLGVIFLGLPVSTLSGNNAAGEVGRLKGEVEAVARSQGKKNCFTTVSSPPVSHRPSMREPAIGAGTARAVEPISASAKVPSTSRMRTPDEIYDSLSDEEKFVADSLSPTERASYLYSRR